MKKEKVPKPKKEKAVKPLSKKQIRKLAKEQLRMEREQATNSQMIQDQKGSKKFIMSEHDMLLTTKVDELDPEQLEKRIQIELNEANEKEDSINDDERLRLQVLERLHSVVKEVPLEQSIFGRIEQGGVSTFDQQIKDMLPEF